VARSEKIEQGNKTFSAIREKVLSALNRGKIRSDLGGMDSDPGVPLPSDCCPGGEKLFSKVMDGPDFRDLYDKIARVGNGKFYDPNSMAWACIIGLVDAEGKPVFKPTDAQILIEESAGFMLNDMARVVYHVNGMIEDEQLLKVLVKNSSGTANSSSSAPSRTESEFPSESSENSSTVRGEPGFPGN